MKLRLLLALVSIALLAPFAATAKANAASETVDTNDIPVLGVVYEGSAKRLSEQANLRAMRHNANPATILAVTRRNGLWLPIRLGYYDANNHGVGYSKACRGHNYCNVPVMNNITRKGFLEYGGGRYGVEGWILWYNKYGQVRATVLTRNVYELKQGHKLPKGMIQGLITAYCKPRGVCPSWINLARPV